MSSLLPVCQALAGRTSDQITVTTVPIGTRW